MIPCILVADDQPSALLGLQEVLRPLGYSVVIAASSEDTVALLESQAPAVLIAGFFTDGAGLPGIELLTRLAERPPRPPILVRAPGNDPHLRVGLARLGARGLVDTAAPAPVLRGAVESLLREGTHFDPLPPKPSLLTARHLAILQLVARGLPQKQIADTLGLAAVTLHHHLAEARRRFQAPNTAALVALLVERRILHLPPWTLERQTGKPGDGTAGQGDGGTAGRRDGGTAGRRDGPRNEGDRPRCQASGLSPAARGGDRPPFDDLHPDRTATFSASPAIAIESLTWKFARVWSAARPRVLHE